MKYARNLNTNLVKLFNMLSYYIYYTLFVAYIKRRNKEQYAKCNELSTKNLSI